MQSRAYGAIGCLVAVMAGAMLLAGCAGARKAPQTEPQRLVWPAPPQPARIQFVRSLVGEKDLVQDTTFSQQILELLSGVKPPPKRIVEPMGLAVSDDGQRLYVSNFNRLAVFAFDFTEKTFEQIEPLARPVGLCLDADDRLYVVEQAKRQISVFDREGSPIRSITHASVERPTGIAIDRDRGKIYLADTGTSESETHTVKIFDMEGELIGTIGDGKGSGPGQFLYPTYLAVDADGNLYVTDTLNARVQVFDADGQYVKSIGERGNAWGMFDKPKGVALDSFGNVYVVDSGWSNVQIFNEKGQVLLFFGGRGPVPGMLKNPTAIAIDGSNQIYVADFINHRVNLYRLVNTTAEDSFLNPLAGSEGGVIEIDKGQEPVETQSTQHQTEGDGL
jgi:DNA-binding beta-propeller fold protein YncE